MFWCSFTQLAERRKLESEDEFLFINESLKMNEPAWDFIFIGKNCGSELKGPLVRFSFRRTTHFRWEGQPPSGYGLECF